MIDTKSIEYRRAVARSEGPKKKVRNREQCFQLKNLGRKIVSESKVLKFFAPHFSTFALKSDQWAAPFEEAGRTFAELLDASNSLRKRDAYYLITESTAAA
jgi:hypothetical protein